VGQGLTIAGDNDCGEWLGQINTKKGLCIFEKVDDQFSINFNLTLK